MPPFEFFAVGRLPAPEDNVAIATRRLEAGAEIAISGQRWRVDHTVLIGHRFAVRPIAQGEELLSWERPFGVATRAIRPGEYVCNREMLDALAVRRLNAHLPDAPNFENRIVPFVFDESAFRPAPPTEQVAAPATFNGFLRSGNRGVGTRNTIVILGTSSLAASCARQLADKLQEAAASYPTIDGVVAVAHTEGGDPAEPNNLPELLRTLAGYIVHPNVGAVLVVDHGDEPLNNAKLQAYLQKHDYPISHVPHRFLSIGNGLAAALAEGERQVRSWLPAAAAMERTEQPLSGLCLALQCGGSDAFSVIYAIRGRGGGPLAQGRHGGRVNLTETDELIGAESHILARMADANAARAFLAKIERFKARLSWHGASPEGNPSAGNKLRGLYNIVLKSLGAAAKKSPLTRVDHVTDYAQRMLARGYYFMDGPGNDLEGVAGQVGAGCNLVVFVTGNGSITNFPFVPTLKVTTTTARHELLINEMDVNAGRYLDGMTMEALRAETFDHIRRVASGERTKGELAGHAQVSLWRNWRQTDASRVEALRARPVPGGEPLPLVALEREGMERERPVSFSAFHAEGACVPAAIDRIGLILPTSLCASQIARLAAERLNAGALRDAAGISRYVALPHTEGCGFGGQAQYRLLTRSYRGYVTHPSVAAALLLEHGCEKVPNDLVRRELETAKIETGRFGWASVQLDGGIQAVLEKIEDWFEDKTAEIGPERFVLAGLEALTLGLMTDATISNATAAGLAALAAEVVNNGGTVMVPETDALLAARAFIGPLLGGAAPRSTLSYGEPLRRPGFHVVETETMHWVENLSGLGACGAQVFLTVVGRTSRQGHVMLPTLQVREAGSASAGSTDDVDAILPADPVAVQREALRLVLSVAAREYRPKAFAAERVDFQLTRGYLGVST